MIFNVILLILCVSQLYWFWRLWSWLKRSFSNKVARYAIAGTAVGLYALMFVFNVGWRGERRTPIHLTAGEALLGAPFGWWLASSLSAFLLVILFWLAASLALAVWSAVRRLRGRKPKPEIQSPSRRIFLERGATLAAAAPFVGGAYGLLYGRLNLDTPHQPIPLSRLPREFDGFRIAQLSDIHIGPFMTKEEIRRYVAIANSLKPHLIALTGDYVTWDPNTQQAVVEALSGLKAPFGVFGCLGNHDTWTGVEDSITALFGRAGIRILRAESVAIPGRNEAIQLIGVDFSSTRPMHTNEVVKRYLEGVERLMNRDRVNILLSHNPDTFDRAAEIGIDLSLAGHTHGGQTSLEFISPQLAPSRIMTPYVAGLFEKPGGKLYVNRGIGTIGVPIRIGAQPEITLFELKRA